MSFFAKPDDALTEDELMHLHIAAHAPVVALELVDQERKPIFARLQTLGYLEPVVVRRFGVGPATPLLGLSEKGARLMFRTFGDVTPPGVGNDNTLLSEPEEAVLAWLRVALWVSEAALPRELHPVLHVLVGKGLVELRERTELDGRKVARVRLAVIPEVQ